MKTTLHLHVGLPKCGSSTLQEFLIENQAALLDVGFNYPRLVDKAIGNLTPFLMSVRAAYSQDRTVFKHNNPEFDPSRANANLLEAIRSNQSPNMILSSEGVSGQARVSDFKFLYSPFDKVIVHIFFRPPISWVMSHYTQGVKTGKYDSDFESFLKSPIFHSKVSSVLNYANHLDFWTNLFGTDSVKSYFLARNWPSPVDQFLRGIGSEIKVLEKSSGAKNSSPSVFQTCALASTKRTSQTEFLRVSRAVRAVAAKFDSFEGYSFLSKESGDLIEAELKPEMSKFLTLQNGISYSDLFPAQPTDVRKIGFDEIRSSESYIKLRNRLAKRGITIF